MKKAQEKVTSAIVFLRGAVNDLKRHDRVDAMDMLRLAQNEITEARRRIRAALRKDGFLV